MAKKTRREIEENLRNKLANKHNDYVERQQKKYDELWDAYCRARKECDKYQQENEELKEKVQQYEDWIIRLQEFVDMPEDMRKAEIKKMRDEQKFTTYLADSPFFKMLGLYTGGLF
jgi:cell shape-determining protein MreC